MNLNPSLVICFVAVSEYDFGSRLLRYKSFASNIFDANVFVAKAKTKAIFIVKGRMVGSLILPDVVNEFLYDRNISPHNNEYLQFSNEAHGLL